MLSSREVLEQSRSALRQWGTLWEQNARVNGERYRADGRSFKDFLHKGVGRTLLCIGLGPSFEKYHEIIKQYQDNVDIAIVDKALGACIDHGIKPDYVFLSDAVVSYEEWCEPWVDKTEGITLLSNITANPKWQQNWKGPVYFTTNKDNINTQDIYAPISGCYDIIPASSNVGNTIVVFSTQLMNYDKYILTGYEFVFTEKASYYAFRESDKRYWMRHGVAIDSSGNYSYVTQNLLFTCRWLGDFFQAELQPRGVKMYNCSGGSVCTIPNRNLERMLKHSVKRKLTPEERDRILMSHAHETHIISNPNASAQLNHALQNIPNIGEIILKHIKPEVMEWVNQRCA